VYHLLLWGGTDTEYCCSSKRMHDGRHVASGNQSRTVKGLQYYDCNARKRLSIRDDVVRLSRVNCPYPLGARSRNPSHFGSFHGEIPNGIMRPFPSAAHYWQTIIDLSQDPNHSPCRMGWHILALSPASPALTPVLGVSMTFVQTQVLHLTCP